MPRLIKKILKILLIYWGAIAILALVLMFVIGLIGYFFLPKTMEVKAIDSYNLDLMQAACKNDISEMQRIIFTLKKGRQKVGDICPYSTLMEAVKCGSFEATALLLINGADPNLQAQGKQVCDQAILKIAERHNDEPEYRPIIVLLKFFGAKKDLKPLWNESPQ